MGYNSIVYGKACAPGLLGQLARAGCSVAEDGHVVTPDGWWSAGVVVVDDDTITGVDEWGHWYGFDNLVQALHQVEGLETADLIREGEEGGDRERHVYQDGRWYELLVMEACVRRDQMEQARAAAERALAGFALEGQ